LAQLPHYSCNVYTVYTLLGGVAQWLEYRSLTGELSPISMVYMHYGGGDHKTADRDCMCVWLFSCVVRLARVCGLSLQRIGCTSALACGIQRHCSCSYRLSRYVSVMPFYLYSSRLVVGVFAIQLFQSSCRSSDTRSGRKLVSVAVSRQLA